MYAYGSFGNCGRSFFVNRGWGHGGPRWAAWASFGPLGGRRRFFESGEVRLAILSLLKEGPRHGYELIKQLEARSGGLYRASAGTVYPTLQLLEDEGLVASESRDGKRVYRLTAEGEAELEREAETVRGIWGRAEKWEEWSQFLGPETVLLARPLGTLVKSALRAFQAAGDSPEAQEKIRDILDRARESLDAMVKGGRKGGER
jgi:DNA-binding PadR family transcriptional regulator